jgi:hypothetical protein
MTERRLRSFAGRGRSIELWNAGVEGYNTLQQEAYLRQTGLNLQADMVLVQFHLNDFLPLPVLFRDRAGEIAYLPFESEHGAVQPTLFRFSFLYRYLLLRWRPTRAARSEASRRQIEGSVGRIRDLCRQHGLELVFVVFPLFKARIDYEAAEAQWHRWILDILRAAELPYLDLHDYYPKDDTIVQFRETPDDTWHPNVEGHRIAAQAVAHYLWHGPLTRRWKLRSDLARSHRGAGGRGRAAQTPASASD